MVKWVNSLQYYGLLKFHYLTKHKNSNPLLKRQ